MSIVRAVAFLNRKAVKACRLLGVTEEQRKCSADKSASESQNTGSVGFESKHKNQDQFVGRRDLRKN